MGVRRKGREYALQTLYLMDVAHLPTELAFRGIMQGNNIEPPTRAFAKILSDGAAAHLPEIDVLIQRYAQNWEIGRMAALDRNILRLGAYELLYEFETPTSVIIDEAVELAKMFSTPDSGKFVNGILDKIKGDRPAAAGKPAGQAGSSDAHGKTTAEKE